VETPNVTVACQNEKCTAYNEPKKVWFQHLGQNVFLSGPLLCGMCGKTDQEMKRV
jgi:hypothetical protein